MLNVVKELVDLACFESSFDLVLEFLPLLDEVLLFDVFKTHLQVNDLSDVRLLLIGFRVLRVEVFLSLLNEVLKVDLIFFLNLLLKVLAEESC